MNTSSAEPPFTPGHIAALTVLLTPHITDLTPPVDLGRPCGGNTPSTVDTVLPPMLTALLNATSWRGNHAVSRITVHRRFARWHESDLWDRLITRVADHPEPLPTIAAELRLLAHERRTAQSSASRSWAVAALSAERRTDRWRQGPGARLLAAVTLLTDTPQVSP